ncbi:MAG: PD-(D/E)XK nuclease family protein, partial [Candidatus Eremiobacteraeota bacterium]|nr:PD-(D/E)XK nuclease family protein [Candidatus Eremiobacteraeota bacterium]
MSEAFIVEVDAAGTPFVDGPLSHPLLAFICDLTRYAASKNERDARRALCSPFSGVPNVDARALCTAAGERRGVADTIDRERVPLDREGVTAARRFVRALDDIERAYRAQGATAREHIATIRIAFADAAELNSLERDTLVAAGGIATRLDAERPPQTAWDPASLIDALESLARISVAPPSPPHAFAPLRDLEPESPHVVKRRRSHFSASSLGAFAECERRWYYRYVCAAVEDRGSSASTYGSAFHWALERFHQEFPRADGAEPVVLERKLDSYLATSFERYRSGFETNVEYELQRRRAKRTGRRYLAWFLERARRHPFAVIGTETSVELELDGYTFIGFIDRLDRDDLTGAVTVVDYKTGSIAESARHYRENVAQFV